MGGFRSAHVRQLLHNKFVVVLGDSIQRSVYKDLVKFLQKDEFLSEDQLRDKGEIKFENDSLIEGGQLNVMTNETTFREVRQYRSGHHLVRFYFLTRVYSTYLESILSDFQSGPQPDVLIANSCVWDLNRYNDQHLEGYKTNLDHLFLRLKEVLSPQCLIIWSMTMPVGYREYDNSFQNSPHNLRKDIVDANFFSASLADLHNLDVLDMHYHFRYDLHLRCSDSVHWNQQAHRKYTQILLTHIAWAWGVKMPKIKKPKGSPLLPVAPHQFSLDNNSLSMLYSQIQEQEHCSPSLPPFGNDSPQLCDNMTPSYFTPPTYNDPAVRDYGGIYRDSPLFSVPFNRFVLENDPHPMLYPPIEERERCSPGPPPFENDSLLLCANMTSGFSTLPPCSDPAVRDHGGIHRGSPLLPTPPHRGSLENYPHPMLCPPIQERERSGPGSPHLLTPPRRFSLGNDPNPMLYPPIQKRERFDPGSPHLLVPPRRFSLGNDPHPMLYPPIQKRERCDPAPPPLGTGSPKLTPPAFFRLPPGLDITRPQYFPMMPALMDLALREPLEMNIHPRKKQNWRGVRSHPYHAPSEHLYHAPTEHPNHAPPEHLYHAPAEHPYHAPAEHPYHAPAEYPYHAPAEHPYHAPTEHPYHAPAEHPYHAPAEHPYHLGSDDLH